MLFSISWDFFSSSLIFLLISLISNLSYFNLRFNSFNKSSSINFKLEYKLFLAISTVCIFDKIFSKSSISELWGETLPTNTFSPIWFKIVSSVFLIISSISLSSFCSYFESIKPNFNLYKSSSFKKSKRDFLIVPFSISIIIMK